MADELSDWLLADPFSRLKPQITALQPFDWWWSGRYWYCSLRLAGSKRVSGAGLTKPQAVADARKELQKRRAHG